MDNSCLAYNYFLVSPSTFDLTKLDQGDVTPCIRVSNTPPPPTILVWFEMLLDVLLR